ncbi:MAG: hypothetical protein COB69_02595 [Phycisphaera sp.]|nr:MAG: hypothetical protein COB69_02595 [Phycisphaera sp.]
MPPSESAPKKNLSSKKLVLLGIKLVVSVGLLYFLLRGVDFNDVKDKMLQADRRYLAIAFLTPYAGFFITSLRWKGLLAVQGVKVRQAVLFRSCMVAVFFNQLMPSIIGGDVVRVYDSWKAGASKSVAVSTIFIDRVLGLFALSIFAVAGLFMISKVQDGTHYVPLLVVLVAFGLAASVAMIFSPIKSLLTLARKIYSVLPRPAAKFFGKLDQAVEVYRGRHLVLIRAMVLSLILQFNVVLLHLLIGKAIGIELGFFAYFYVVPIAFFVMLIPLTINGIGVRENMFVFMLGGLGVASQDALALALLAYFVFLVHGVFGGIVLAIRGISPAMLTKHDYIPNAGDTG